MPDTTIGAGVLTTDIDGTMIDVEGTFDIQPNSLKYSAKIASSGRVYSVAEPIAPGFKCAAIVTASVTGAWYASIRNKSGSIKLRDGRTYTFSQLNSMGEFPHAAQDGTVALEFFAQSCTEG